MPGWLETIIAVSGGAVGLHLFKLLQELIRAKSRTDGKKVIDETQISRTLLQVNQYRFESVLRELEEVRGVLNRLEKSTRELEIANLHLRHLIGLGPNDIVPETKEDLKKLQEDKDD